jgi:glycopeptide antibiotics resistance protein
MPLAAGGCRALAAPQTVLELETNLPFAPEIDLKAARKLRWAGHVMLAMIVFGSILPLQWSWEGVGRWPLLFNWQNILLPDFLQNIAAFGPVGVVYGASRDRAAVWRCVLLAVAVAVGLQLVQLWLPARSPALTDAFANSLGLMAGIGFAAATHKLRHVPASPLPIDVAILLLLLCHFLMIFLIEFGAGDVMDQWLLHAGGDADAKIKAVAKLLVAGLVVRAMIKGHNSAVWLFLLLCTACGLFGASLTPAWLALILLAGGLAAQWMPRTTSNMLAIAALLVVQLWEGLTPWVPVSRDMNWVPLQSLLRTSNLAAFVTLAWKLFCWSALARLLCHWHLRGRTITLLVAGLTGMIECAQMFLASGFPDITDILLAAGLSGLVVLVVQQSGDETGALTR